MNKNQTIKEKKKESSLMKLMWWLFSTILFSTPYSLEIISADTEIYKCNENI